ncbi:MAG: flavodoxin family protein [Candidatus Omnitrophica bacterium]|nr:flavodoxin family protein [Candidatus Omnitrophota bacterium]
MSEQSSPEFTSGREKARFVLGLVGSPRQGGNSDILVEQALEGARSAGARTEKIVINLLKVSPCQACDTVRDDGTCLIEDDFQYIYAKVREAHAIVVASPLYFGSISAQTKAVIDRFQCHWRVYGGSPEKSGRAKRGGFICAAASSRRDFFENAAGVVKNFFATVGAQYCEELFCPDLEEKGGVRNRPQCLIGAVALGRKLLESA